MNNNYYLEIHIDRFSGKYVSERYEKKLLMDITVLVDITAKGKCKKTDKRLF